MTVCTCIRDRRDVRRVAVQDPYCPACHAASAVQGARPSEYPSGWQPA